ncbi:L-threonine O-3-phosphate decarboxylase [Shimia gijangensis]|uniref:Aminotransferase n=1 Tax=Shimia gijangensis TaxID=1470563 RepID=A0A1M6BGZ6_9RHOB|nr:threonine-phosphate decarboxylase [Shimia gijangensis]SHI47985.1 L-threonine O-3-phosphate decarboxylase [Shimia gijangensis]
MSSSSTSKARDHGGGLDAAIARWGGARRDWVDLSTGINPVSYPLADFPHYSWTSLPDRNAQTDLLSSARHFWNVPDDAAILAAPGASALIARIPALTDAGRVDIPTPTYNEHAAAFVAQGWALSDQSPEARVLVHPNNPTGKLWNEADLTAPLTVVDESFCDVTPDASLVHTASESGRIILKSFGKFWGLAGIRLGFAIAHPDTISRLSDLSGPWAVSGPALHLGAKALQDRTWADATRQRLTEDAARLDALIAEKGGKLAGGTSLFRLYSVDNATSWQNQLAQHHVWSRIFPYSKTFLRLGLPAPDQWAHLEQAL